jgi:hypothetical protein
MWSAGLAYSNGLEADPEHGLLEYNAIRAPNPAAVLRFAASVVADGKPPATAVDYALANVFAFSREAQSYEARASALAEDLAYGPSPTRVRRFTRALLELAHRGPQAGLLADLRREAGRAFAKVIAPADASTSADSLFLFVGPEPQLSSLEPVLGRRPLLRIYPSDLWLSDQ